MCTDVRGNKSASSYYIIWLVEFDFMESNWTKIIIISAEYLEDRSEAIDLRNI